MEWLTSLLGGGAGGFAGSLLGGLKDNENLKKIFGPIGDFFSGLTDMFSGFLMSIFSSIGLISKAEAPAKQSILDGIKGSDGQIQAVTDALKITSPELTASIKTALQKTTTEAFGIMGLPADGLGTAETLVKLQSNLTSQIALALVSKPENRNLTNDQAKEMAAIAAAAITGLDPHQANAIEAADKDSADYKMGLARIAANPPTNGLGGSLFGTQKLIATAGKDATSVNVPALAMTVDPAAINRAQNSTPPAPAADPTLPPPGPTPPGKPKPPQAGRA